MGRRAKPVVENPPVTQAWADVVDTLQETVEYYISEFCEKYGIDDLSKESQNRFNACMKYVGGKMFTGTDTFYEDDDTTGMPPTFCRAYDIRKLDKLLDYYVYLCTLYDKVVNVTSFAFLAGMSVSTIWAWEQGMCSTLNRGDYEFAKKIRKLREFTMREAMVTGKRNVCTITIFNDEFVVPNLAQDVQPRLSNEDIARQIGADAVPALPVSGVPAAGD